MIRSLFCIKEIPLTLRLSENVLFVIPANRLCRNAVFVIAKSEAMKQSNCNLLISLDRHASLRLTRDHKTNCDTAWKAGIHLFSLDSRLRGNDNEAVPLYETSVNNLKSIPIS